MFLDIGVGILLAILSSELFGIELSATWVFLGILFSLIPDVDVFVEYAKYRKVGGKEIRIHRELTHYPLLYIPIVVSMCIFWNSSGAFLFGCAVFAHFVHDSIWLGWGIKWLAPFSKKNFKFFAGKDGKFSKQLVVSWEPEEFKKTVAKFGNPNWVRDNYLKLSKVSIFEFLVFVIALIILFSYLN